jgi:hypothetical protein
VVSGSGDITMIVRKAFDEVTLRFNTYAGGFSVVVPKVPEPLPEN